MSGASHISIQFAAQLPGESQFLDAVVDDLANENSRLVYADWLEEQGDTLRAAFLRDYANAFKTMEPGDFPSEKEVPREWAHMIGARIVHAIAANGLAEHRDEWLPLAKPSLKYATEDAQDDDIPIGATKLYGLPDLPPGTSWPTQKDCKVLYDPDSGIEPETQCSFVAQINLADLVGSQVARLCPSQGLISIFSCAEIASIGMVDAFVMFTPDTDNLVRTDRSGPQASDDDDDFDEDDEANELIDPKTLQLFEMLELPEMDGDSPFKQLKYSWDSEFYDPYRESIRSAGCGDLETILGYTRKTSGGDPLPGKDWCQLICVENSIEMVLHLAIKNGDLAAGRFDNMQLAWVDFD